MGKANYLIILISSKTLAFCNATQVLGFFYWVPEMQAYRWASIRPLCQLFWNSKFQKKNVN